MKRKLLLLSIFSFCLSLGAQEHLRFKGIPIMGNVSEFALKLKNIGYTLLDSSDNMYFLTGSFAGFDNVTIAVVGTPKTNTAYKVAVFFEEKETFSSLETQYRSLLKSYSDKYGNPEKSYDFFIDPYYKGDGYEMQALRKDKCRYISFFTIDRGYLTVEISKMQKVVVNYEDLEGSNIFTKERNSIVNDDI